MTQEIENQDSDKKTLGPSKYANSKKKKQQSKKKVKKEPPPPKK